MGFLTQVSGVVARGFSNLRKKNYFTVAIIGRPNVGKSTLFNRLVGRKLSLVDNLPGLTRDRIEGTTNLFGVGIKFVDTAGWDPHDTPNSPTIVEKMIQQTHNALKCSDLSLFLLDCKAGVTGADSSLAKWLHAHRKASDDSSDAKDIILVANKAESNYTDDFENRVFRLNFGEPVYISAAQGDRMVDLYAKIREKIPDSYFEEQEAKGKRISEKYIAYKTKFAKELDELETQLGESINKKELLREFEDLNPSDMSELDSDAEYDPEKIIAKPALPGELRSSKSNKPIQMAIIGRPNVGKSTFVNALLKTDRVIADQMPGTTRDSVYTEFNFEGRNITLVDTAGLVKHPKGKLPTLIKDEVMRAIKYSQVVVLLFDSMTALTTMDLDLVRQTVAEGRALIVTGNKWDLVSSEWRKKAAEFMADQLKKTVDVKGLPLLFLSAKECSRLNDFMALVVKTYDKWNIRVSTGYLNRWLGAFKKVQSLPAGGGERLSIKYMTQLKSRPPTFYVVVNNKELMKENYLKNFRNALSKEFGLEGVAIRILLRDKAEQKQEKAMKKKKLKPGLFVNSKQVGKSAILEGVGKGKKWKELKIKPKSDPKKSKPKTKAKIEEE